MDEGFFGYPDRRMNLDALEKCGHDAKDTVFIDDSPQNLQGAAELGITPMLIATNPALDVIEIKTVQNIRAGE